KSSPEMADGGSADGASSSAARADPPPASDGRRLVSPIARKRATELGIDLAGLSGTGPGGRITREDVERAAQSESRPAAAPTRASAAEQSATVTVPKPRVRGLPMRGMRKTIAARM